MGKGSIVTYPGMDNGDVKQPKKKKPSYSSAHSGSGDCKPKFEVDNRLPHEILLSIARGEPQLEYETIIKASGVISYRKVWKIPTIRERTDAANKCANYYAHKLQAQTITIEDDSKVLDAIKQFVQSRS